LKQSLFVHDEAENEVQFSWADFYFKSFSFSLPNSSRTVFCFPEKKEKKNKKVK